MKYSPADVVRWYLAVEYDNSSSFSMPSARANWPVFVDSMPIDGDFCICVYNTAGFMDGRNLRTGEGYEHPGLQFRIRGRAKPDREAYTKARELQGILDAIKRVTLNVGPEPVSYRIDAVTRRSNVIPLGEEPERNRLLYTINAIITCQEN